jgi:hypothetical protein
MKDSTISLENTIAADGDPVQPHHLHSSCLNRRHFLRLAALGSTALFVPCDLLEALESPAASHPAAPALPGFAAFWPLAPGAVRADDWLAGWLGKQAEGLGYHLPDTSWPFSSPYRQGLETNGQSEEWWPWEQKAYWIDGATRLNRRWSPATSAY